MLSPNPLRRTLSTVLVLATLTCAQVSHAILVTGSFDGTVTSGRTYVSSTFGNYQSLYGRSVSGTFSYETEPVGVYGYTYSHRGYSASNTDSWLSINVSIDGVAVPVTTTTANPHERITTYNTASYDRLELFDRNGYSSRCGFRCYTHRANYNQFSLVLHDYTGNSLSSGAIPVDFNATSGYGSIGVMNRYTRSCSYYSNCGTTYYPESLYANFSITNVRFNSTSVPEAGTLGLLALGLVGLGMARRTQRA